MLIIVLIFFSQAAFSQLDTLWTKTYSPDEDTLGFIGISILPTFDGGFVVLGEQTSENIEPDIFLLKADSNGENLWTKLLPNSNYEYVKAFSIDETQNGGLTVLTRESNFNCQEEPDSSSNVILVITSMNFFGDTLWTRTLVNNYLADQNELCSQNYKGLILHDGNYLIFGHYLADGEIKTWLLKTDSEGNIIWENSYDLSTTTDITEGGDGNIYISGGYGMWGSPTTAYIVKINQNGTQEWIHNESSSFNTSGGYIYPIVDNGLAVVGTYSSTDPNWNATGPWLWTIDSLGNTEWDIVLDDVGINSYGDLVQHEDGTFIILGGVTQVGLSYALINIDEELSYNLTFSGFYVEPRDIKTLTYNTQIALINYSYNYDPHFGIIKSIYNSSYCVAEDSTEGVELWGECYSIQNTTGLHLFYNELADIIPSEIGNLINLTSLTLEANELYGEIPSEIGNLTNLTDLNLDGNQLTGEIPSELGNLTNLTSLSLSGNNLTGEIPSELFGLVNLSGYVSPTMIGLKLFHGLNLSDNLLTGEIPSEIGNLINLISIDFSQNQLTGEIPSEIGNLINLESLNLSDNQLTGEIPSEISNLINLNGIVTTGHMSITTYPALDLSENQFSGLIPESLCSLPIEWGYNSYGESEFSIDENQFCPPYPSCIEDYVGEQDTTNCEQMSIIYETLPNTYILYNAYPNPFNPVTTLRYDLPENALVNITIYDMMGKQVNTLVSSQKTAGYKSVQWNATNYKGARVSAGLYLYRIQAGEFRQTKKMILLK